MAVDVVVQILLIGPLYSSSCPSYIAWPNSSHITTPQSSLQSHSLNAVL